MTDKSPKDDADKSNFDEAVTDFNDIDPYEVLGLNVSGNTKESRAITSDQIKKAYRRKALTCHPDKAKTDAERAAFHTEFQMVALAYSVLSDETGRRKRYDQTGSMEAATSAFAGEGSEEDMRAFFEELWKSDVTAEMVEQDKQVYRGGGEERADVLKYYTEGKGRMDVIFENVLHTVEGDEDDEARIRGYIEDAIARGEVKEYKAFRKKESAADKTKRLARAKKEAREAEELSKELGLDKLKKGKGGKSKDGESDEDALRALIQSRGQKRMSSLIDTLEAKYGAKPKSKKRK